MLLENLAVAIAPRDWYPGQRVANGAAALQTWGRAQHRSHLRGRDHGAGLAKSGTIYSVGRHPMPLPVDYCFSKETGG